MDFWCSVFKIIFLSLAPIFKQLSKRQGIVKSEAEHSRVKAELARSQKSTSKGRRSLQGRKTRAVLKGKAAETASPLSKDAVRAGTHHSKRYRLAYITMDDRHRTVPLNGKDVRETLEKVVFCGET